MVYTRQNIIRGGLIYGIGDTIASIILDEFSIYRLLCMMFIGGTLYALEIPNYFNWIEQKVKEKAKPAFWKTGYAIAYFNPLWILRHMVFIKLFSMHFSDINISLFNTALLSFVFNIPISIIANYIIQNKIKMDWRFMASAVFSGLMAIYYALSVHWF